eukprot:6588210-Alexandrium_andersonii.AAC.1
MATASPSITPWYAHSQPQALLGQNEGLPSRSLLSPGLRDSSVETQEAGDYLPCLPGGNDRQDAQARLEPDKPQASEPPGALPDNSNVPGHDLGS